MNTKSTNKVLIQRLNSAVAHARKTLVNATSSDKDKLEIVWDIEHAYYSSALEGSKIDRKEFDLLAKQVK